MIFLFISNYKFLESFYSYFNNKLSGLRTIQSCEKIFHDDPSNPDNNCVSQLMTHLQEESDLCPYHKFAYLFCISIQTKKEMTMECKKSLESSDDGINNEVTTDNNNNLKPTDNQESEQTFDNAVPVYPTKLHAENVIYKRIVADCPESLYNWIHSGQFKILFEKGTNEERARLELISSGVTRWKRNLKIDTSLPNFFTEEELNRIIQITVNDLKKIDVDEIGSDYSYDYNSEDSEKPYDKAECRNFDPEVDHPDDRPVNYSSYLKAEGVPRNRRLQLALNTFGCKEFFIRSLRYHRCFIRFICHQKIDAINLYYRDYTCPW